MAKRTTAVHRSWIIGGVALVLALVLGANAHLLYVALSSQPGCAEETLRASTNGELQALRPAKDVC